MSANVFRDSFVDPDQAQHDSSQTAARPKRSKLSSLPGGGKATCAFFLSLIAYTLQTEFAQYVQQSLNYRKPFLSLYLGHSGFMLLFPMHLLFLKWTTKRPYSHYLHLIAQNLQWQLDSPVASLPDPGPDAVRRRLSSASGRGSQSFGDDVNLEPGEISLRRPISSLQKRFGFNVLKLVGLFGILTLGITVPALSWYCAVPMTSMADITAIYNTFSVWALVFSVWFLGEKWEKRKVFSVLLACFGVVVVAYGGAEHRKKPKPIDPVHGKPTEDDPAAILAIRALHNSVADLFLRRDSSVKVSATPINPVLGDILAFVGAVTMAAYEMAFKMIGTLPDEAKQAEMYSVVSGGRNRRSRSYVRYADDHDNGQAEHETEGLLRAPPEGEEQQPQHVVGMDDDEEGDITYTAKTAESAGKPQSTVIDKLIDQDRPDYQSITPPPERASFATDDADSKPIKMSIDGVRVQSKSVRQSQHDHRHSNGNAPSNNDDSEAETGDEEDQITESELEDGEEDLVRSGATRLHRTRSQLSSHRVSSSADVDTDARTSTDRQRPGTSRRTSSYHRKAMNDPSIPPPLPFGLHANIMTAGIGFTTFFTFWIGLLIAHYLGWEPFELPHNLWTCFSILMVVICGVFFNGAFMILLSLWGPVLASVSCLMTTILVEIADVLLGHPLKWVSVIGCSLIGAGFVVLVGGDASH